MIKRRRFLQYLEHCVFLRVWNRVDCWLDWCRGTLAAFTKSWPLNTFGMNFYDKSPCPPPVPTLTNFLWLNRHKIPHRQTSEPYVHFYSSISTRKDGWPDTVSSDNPKHLTISRHRRYLTILFVLRCYDVSDYQIMSIKQIDFQCTTVQSSIFYWASLQARLAPSEWI